MGDSVKLSLGFLFSAVIAFLFLDTEVSTLYPWQELSRMAYGFVLPNFMQVEEIVVALLKTFAFAIVGITLASFFALLLSLVFHYKIVQVGCAFFEIHS